METVLQPTRWYRGDTHNTHGTPLFSHTKLDLPECGFSLIRLCLLLLWTSHLCLDSFPQVPNRFDAAHAQNREDAEE